MSLSTLNLISPLYTKWSVLNETNQATNKLIPIGGSMKAYKILKAISQESLEKLVVKKLAEGWVLQGGLSIGDDGYGNIAYCQAVIKY